MRLFVAIDIPKDIQDTISKFKDSIQSTEDIKWVPMENVHLTLKFLGEVPNSNINDVITSLKKALSSFESFSLSIEGTGTFGKPPRVLWIGIKNGRGVLIELMGSINNELYKIRQENHRPSPHITIGRLKTCVNPAKFKEDVNHDSTFGKFKVSNINLMKSELTGNGPVYTLLETFKLDKNEP